MYKLECFSLIMQSNIRSTFRWYNERCWSSLLLTINIIQTHLTIYIPYSGNKTTFCPRGRKVRGSQTSNILAGKGNKEKSYQEIIIYFIIKFLCFNCILLFCSQCDSNSCKFPFFISLLENCYKKEWVRIQFWWHSHLVFAFFLMARPLSYVPDNPPP